MESRSSSPAAATLEAGAAREDQPRGAGPLVRIALIGVVVIVLFFVGRQAGGYVPQFAAWVDQLGFWGPLVFMAGYAIATVAFVPGSLLTLSAGAIFGLGEGILWVFLAASAGATAAFLVSRYVARRAVENKLAGSSRFAAIDAAVGREGLKIVVLLRLSPMVPFNTLNYALGLTNVRLRDYMLGCLGMLPGTLLYVYYGKLAGDVAALAGGGQVERGWEYWTVMVLGLIATVVVTTLVTRIALRALKAEIADA